MTTDLSGPSRRKHTILMATAAAVIAIDLARRVIATTGNIDIQRIAIGLLRKN